ncbi:hypothetical protein J2S44_001122 [Catenuloplanes niger]|uniref:Uncharacterized protein n=1 Tax=Catenuloplanes niger TaxID=587534 RepID=A0AAE3ZJ58_9ACTN|nr:hypothetical protein [Catenuloplanes niger]
MRVGFPFRALQRRTGENFTRPRGLSSRGSPPSASSLQVITDRSVAGRVWRCSDSTVGNAWASTPPKRVGGSSSTQGPDGRVYVTDNIGNVAERY